MSYTPEQAAALRTVASPEFAQWILNVADERDFTAVASFCKLATMVLSSLGVNEKENYYLNSTSSCMLALLSGWSKTIVTPINASKKIEPNVFPSIEASSETTKGQKEAIIKTLDEMATTLLTITTFGTRIINAISSKADLTALLEGDKGLVILKECKEAASAFCSNSDNTKKGETDKFMSSLSLVAGGWLGKSDFVALMKRIQEKPEKEKADDVLSRYENAL